MRNNNISFISLTPLILGLSLLVGCSDKTNATATTTDAPQAVTAQQPEDTIARVGDQTITYSELTTMLNSSALVGLSVPALGTPKRSQVMITLLDKVISANLLYLDALEQGTDGKAPYTTDMKHFEEAV